MEHWTITTHENRVHITKLKHPRNFTLCHTKILAATANMGVF